MEDIGRSRKVLLLDEERIVLQMKLPRKKEKISHLAGVLATAMEIGFSISLPMVAGALLGVYLDNRLNTQPKLTLSFLFFGLFIGCFNVYRAVIIEFKQR